MLSSPNSCPPSTPSLPLLPFRLLSLLVSLAPLSARTILRSLPLLSLLPSDTVRLKIPSSLNDLLLFSFFFCLSSLSHLVSHSPFVFVLFSVFSLRSGNFLHAPSFAAGSLNRRHTLILVISSFFLCLQQTRTKTKENKNKKRVDHGVEGEKKKSKRCMNEMIEKKRKETGSVRLEPRMLKGLFSSRPLAGINDEQLRQEIDETTIICLQPVLQRRCLWHDRPDHKNNQKKKKKENKKKEKQTRWCHQIGIRRGHWDEL